MDHEHQIRAAEIAAAGIAAMRTKAREIATETNTAIAFEERWLRLALQQVAEEHTT